MRNPYIIGKHCYLRQPTQEDADGVWHEWLSDEETTRHLSSRAMPNSLESQNAFYQSTHDVGSRLVLSIVDITTDNADVAAVAGGSACTQAGGTWDGSTCTAASNYNCFVGGFCSQAAIAFPPVRPFTTSPQRPRKSH